MTDSVPTLRELLDAIDDLHELVEMMRREVRAELQNNAEASGLLVAHMREFSMRAGELHAVALRLEKMATGETLPSPPPSAPMDEVSDE